MDLYRQCLVCNKRDFDGVCDLVPFAGAVFQLRDGILADAQLLNEDFALGVGRKRHIVAVDAGDAERKALFLSVAGGLNNLEGALQSMVDKALSGFVLNGVGFSVGIDLHIVGFLVRNKALRCGFLPNQYAAVLQFFIQ